MNPDFCRTGDFLPDASATVDFTLVDGSTITFYNVNADSIGPSAEHPGVIGVEFENDADRVVHVPFVRYWEISYS